MDNLHLFELINAAPGIDPVRLAIATALAEWLVCLVPAAFVFAWLRGDAAVRRDLLQMALVILLALLAAETATHAWPQPRPFALHVGTQYLHHGGALDLPGGPAVVFWSLALATLATTRFAVWAFPLLALGLAAGVSRVYLGADFPFDIAAALPDALMSLAIVLALRARLAPAMTRILLLYDRAARRVEARFR